MNKWQIAAFISLVTSAYIATDSLIAQKINIKTIELLIKKNKQLKELNEYLIEELKKKRKPPIPS